jgi:polyisoprenoid-binding protein YceI
MATMRGLIALSVMAASAVAPAAPATYKIDPDHTYPSFEADHMGLSTFRGKFNKAAGRVVIDRSAATGSVEVAVDLASIDFGHDELNQWATSAEFFDVAKHPQAIYKGRLEGFSKGVPTRVAGELTLHGVTRPVPLRIDAFRCKPHPVYKREVCGADAQGSFQRDLFGLDSGKDYGFGMDVNLRIQIEAIQAE